MCVLVHVKNTSMFQVSLEGLCTPAVSAKASAVHLGKVCVQGVLNSLI